MADGVPADRRIEAILAACDADDWDAAAEQLRDYDAWLRREAAAGRLGGRAEVEAALVHHDGLVRALRERRADCIEQLGAMSRGTRGVQAYGRDG